MIQPCCDHDHHDEHHHSETQSCWYRGGPFVNELSSHLPFSILSVTFGLILAGLICFFASDETLLKAGQMAAHHHEHYAESEVEAEDHQHEHSGSEDADHHHDEAAVLTKPGEAHGHGSHGGFLILFHLFHPVHMLFSAAATTAMFWRYERAFFKAILVGFSGAVVVCGVSDIFIPYLSDILMGRHQELHICIIDHPWLILPFAFVGVLLGLLAPDDAHKRSTIFSHSSHVAVSTMASIFYLLGPFERLEWINDIGTIFFYTCIAVVIPCCFSDLAYPFLFTKKGRADYAAHGHVHPH